MRRDVLAYCTSMSWIRYLTVSDRTDAKDINRWRSFLFQLLRFAIELLIVRRCDSRPRTTRIEIHPYSSVEYVTRRDRLRWKNRHHPKNTFTPKLSNLLATMSSSKRNAYWNALVGHHQLVRQTMACHRVESVPNVNSWTQLDIPIEYDYDRKPHGIINRHRFQRSSDLCPTPSDTIVI